MLAYHTCVHRDSDRCRAEQWHPFRSPGVQHVHNVYRFRFGNVPYRSSGRSIFRDTTETTTRVSLSGPDDKSTFGPARSHAKREDDSAAMSGD